MAMFEQQMGLGRPTGSFRDPSITKEATFDYPIFHSAQIPFRCDERFLVCSRLRLT